MTVKKVSDSFELPLESKKELCDTEYVCENLHNRTSTFRFVGNSEIRHADAVKCLHWKRIEQVNSGVDPVVAQRASRIAGHIAYKGVTYKCLDAEQYEYTLSIVEEFCTSFPRVMRLKDDGNESSAKSIIICSHDDKALAINMYANDEFCFAFRLNPHGLNGTIHLFWNKVMASDEHYCKNYFTSSSYIVYAYYRRNADGGRDFLYIGKTVRPLQVRHREHLMSGENEKACVFANVCDSDYMNQTQLEIIKQATNLLALECASKDAMDEIESELIYKLSPYANIKGTQDISSYRHKRISFEDAMQQHHDDILKRTEYRLDGSMHAIISIDYAA